MTAMIYNQNSIDLLPTFPQNSFDAIITDPPYELGFMGKKWDASGIAFNVTLWAECLRVLKPGGHLLAFGGTRTYHRMAVAIEDAGFEIRDSIQWVYGSGFPKSLDVSKAIDKAAGAEREVVGKHPNPGSTAKRTSMGDGWQVLPDITAPATDAAKQWQGWGTALKPAHEPIVLARKPLPDTVANNVLTYRTGALNIDACRIQREPGDTSQAGHRTATFGTQNTTSGGDGSGGWEQNDLGRWPANIILDPDAAEELGPEARYFYCAKPSKAERNAGLENFPKRDWKSQGFRDNESTHLSPRAGAGRTSANQNFHPTVKPLALMRYLIRLVTPPGGIVLDPFAGSGTTVVAAILENHDCTGIELMEDYIPIIEARIEWAKKTQLSQSRETTPTLFDEVTP